MCEVYRAGTVTLPDVSFRRRKSHEKLPVAMHPHVLGECNWRFNSRDRLD
jgi:hypothetical protein